MGTGVTFKPGGPSCPGGPRAPTPTDPCKVAQSMWHITRLGAQGCQGHHATQSQVGGPPGDRGHVPSPLWLQRTPWLPVKTPSPQQHQGSRWQRHRSQPPRAPTVPNIHPPPLYAFYSHLPRDLLALQTFLAPPGRGKRRKKQMCGIMNWGSSCSWIPTRWPSSQGAEDHTTPPQ